MKGSVNTFVGKHPLGDRARKINQGILIVRFVSDLFCLGLVTRSYSLKRVTENAKNDSITVNLPVVNFLSLNSSQDSNYLITSGVKVAENMSEKVTKL